MEHGTEIARICYEKILPSGDKKYVPIGRLIYFRAHKEGAAPSCQFRWDVVPSSAWMKNPETWFIGNFIPSEKVPEAPSLDGDIYVTSDVLNDHVVIGHIKSRERDGEENPDYAVQYYMQLYGLPVGAYKKQLVRSFMKAVELWVTTERAMEEPNSTKTMMRNLEELFKAKSKSVYCSIEM